MEFTLHSDLLQQMVGVIKGATKKKDLAERNCVWIRTITENSMTSFAAVDLDFAALGCTRKGLIAKEGIVCVSAEKLGSITKVLSAGMVKFAQDETVLHVHAGHSRWKVPLINREYPDVPTDITNLVRFEGKVFLDALQRVKPIVTAKENHYPFVQIVESTFIATNNRQAVVVYSKVEGDIKGSFQLSKKGVVELIGVLQGNIENIDSVYVGGNDTWIQVTFAGSFFWVRLLGATCPNVGEYFNKPKKAILKVRRELFMSYLKFMDGLGDSRAAVDVSVSKDNIRLDVRDTEGTEGTCNFQCEYQGEEFVQRFGLDELRIALLATRGDGLTVEFGEFLMHLTGTDSRTVLAGVTA